LDHIPVLVREPFYNGIGDSGFGDAVKEEGHIFLSEFYFHHSLLHKAECY
jgi:hypothetical protein